MQSHIACSNEVSVTFRFLGGALKPDTITVCMKLTPTTAHAKGEAVPKHPDRKYTTGYWGLDSPLDPSCSLDEHLTHLLDTLESRQSTIAVIKQSGCSVSCAYFAKTFANNATQLAPQTLGRVSALDARLELHIYCDVDTEDVNPEA